MEEKGDQLSSHWMGSCDWQKGQGKSGLWKISLRIVFLNLDCTLGSPEWTFKMLVAWVRLPDLNVIGPGCGLKCGTFISSPADYMVQPDGGLLL